MTIKEIVNEIFSKNASSADDLIRSSGNSEGYFEQMYEGRFIYELLQNARDAIRAKGPETMGNIAAWFEGDVFCFANDGLRFDEAAVKGICYVGMSSKHSTDFVGHKGLGFKSVMEVTERPEIITQDGTVYFDREETSKRINLAPEEIPLFIFPHYRSATIDELYPEMAAAGFTTVMRFPLLYKSLRTLVDNRMAAFQPEEMLFLGNIGSLKLGDRTFTIGEGIPAIKGTVSVHDGKEEWFFRSFIFDFGIEDAAFAILTDKEKELFAATRSVSSHVLLPIDQAGGYERPKVSHLYLFYRMEIETGLGFYLHSYFTAAPDRKGLLDSSKMNPLIFKKVAEWVAGTLVPEIKEEYPTQVLEILHYQRKTVPLTKLYDYLKIALGKVALVFSEQGGEFLGPIQVSLLSAAWSELLVGERSGTRTLIYPGSTTIREWLVTEYCCGPWSEEKAPTVVEAICPRKLEDVGFFQRLYEIVRSKKIDFTARKVLLTEHGKLVAGNTTQVFYGAKLQSIPEILSEQVSSLHPEIKYAWFKTRDEYLGIRSYEKENLIQAALQSLGKVPVGTAHDEAKKLTALKYLASLVEDRHIPDIRGRVEVPVVGQKEWINPFKQPIYLSNYRYLSVTPKAKVLDEEKLRTVDVAVSEMDLDRFWRLINVRSIPGTFTKRTFASSLDAKQRLHLQKERPGIVGAVIENDRAIDLPNRFDEEFGSMIIGNWVDYHSFFNSAGSSPMMHVVGVDRQPFKSLDNAVKVSNLVRTLRENSWVNIPGKAELKRPEDVVGMQPEEMGLEENKLLIEFLNVVPLDQTLNQLFIQDLELFHFKQPNRSRLVSLMKWIATEYGDADQSLLREKRFSTFFNKMLSLCFEEYEKILPNQPQHRTDFVNQLKGTLFLGKPIVGNEYRWLPSSRLILMDDPKLLDGLDEEIKGQIEHPYLFTKRDRNEFGKLGKHLGRLISKEVQLSVASTKASSTTILNLVPCLELVLAVLEDSLHRTFSEDELKKIMHSDVEFHDHLLVQYSFSNRSKDRPELYYCGDSDALYLGKGVTIDEHPMQFAAALVGFFETLIDRDFRSDDAVLSILFTESITGRALEYVLGRGVDLSRIEALREIVDREKGQVLKPSVLKPSMITRDERPKTADRLPLDATVPQTVVPWQVKQHEIKMTLEELLRRYGQLVIGDQIEDDFETRAGETTKRKTRGKGSGNPSEGTELTDHTKGLVGMVGEHLIWSGLTEGDADLLATLGIPFGEELEIDWYNVGRLKNPQQQDGSIGKGCDIHITSHGKYIEVKAAVEDSPLIYITGTELQHMKLHRERYFLIIIKRLLRGHVGRIVKVVRNPYQRILDGGLDMIVGTYRDRLG